MLAMHFSAIFTPLLLASVGSAAVIRENDPYVASLRTYSKANCTDGNQGVGTVTKSMVGQCRPYPVDIRSMYIDIVPGFSCKCLLFLSPSLPPWQVTNQPSILHIHRPQLFDEPGSHASAQSMLSIRKIARETTSELYLHQRAPLGLPATTYWKTRLRGWRILFISRLPEVEGQVEWRSHRLIS
ncbi:hypothetical protein F4778DRAFT_23654 [Xylariomycetidae sp. FL2044]|nr:hypothetical protein F4778DRAFT_23654 [Xylariomycetidae sp. FL2044]